MIVVMCTELHEEINGVCTVWLIIYSYSDFHELQAVIMKMKTKKGFRCFHLPVTNKTKKLFPFHYRCWKAINHFLKSLYYKDNIFFFYIKLCLCLFFVTNLSSNNKLVTLGIYKWYVWRYHIWVYGNSGALMLLARCTSCNLPNRGYNSQHT